MSSTISCRPIPNIRSRNIIGAVVAVCLFTAMTALMAKISVPVPGTPVPMTLQTAVVLCSGLALGPRLGLASQALYLLVGLAGIPVFAQPGAGPSYVFGASFGYLIGFVFAPFIVGQLAGLKRTWQGCLLGVVAGETVILTLGAAWLLAQTGSLGLALQYGVFPFVMVELLKCATAAGAGFLWDSKRSGCDDHG